MTELGREITDNIDLKSLSSGGSSKQLAAHTEGIYCPGGITPYFSLACVRPAASGGFTRLFDGRIAAQKIREEHPEFSGVRIRYGSQAHPGVFATHNLIENDALRYRAKVHTNTLLDANGSDEDGVYRAVDSALERSLMLAHKWKRGDILVVDNRVTIHDRTPFQGMRIMVRARYGDTIHESVRNTL